MARLPRLCPIGIPQHVIQRGNNRQICFTTHQDVAAYSHWLCEYSKKHGVDIHAWVFMTNHVHLLVTPTKEMAVSKMMQSLGRSYVRYYNREYARTGTLWEGRYKSCLVDTRGYLLTCYRYIELNPVRAGLVDNPGEYHWSSYRSNGLGVKTELIKPHAEYLQLGENKERRLINYRALFEGHLDISIIDEITESTNKGLVFGSEKFKDQMEENLNRRVRVGKPGPRNSQLLL